MLLDVAEGKLKAGDIKMRLGEYVKAHHQQFGIYTKDFGLVRSLDQHLSDDRP